jgi:hypothetical protein
VAGEVDFDSADGIDFFFAMKISRLRKSVDGY